MAEICITKDDHGKTFEVMQGDSIMIRLEEIPTTGYRWKINKIDNQIITSKDSVFSVSSDAGIGGGGTTTFILSALSAGSARVRLILGREWETPNSSIDCFEINIHVRSK